jgi:hypothetical protein
MVHTVPEDVQLTEIIEPLPVKPVVTLIYASNGTFALSGNVRVRSPCGLLLRLFKIPQFWDLDDSDDPQVSIAWAGETGKQCDGCSAVLSHDKTFEFGISMPGNHRAPWYILPDGGIHMGANDAPKFWFEIAQKGTRRVEDNGGNGFPLQKKVVLSDTSCVSENDTFARWDIAVRSWTGASNSIQLSDTWNRS